MLGGPLAAAGVSGSPASAVASTNFATSTVARSRTPCCEMKSFGAKVSTGRPGIAPSVHLTSSSDA